ncbi:hypothetical protein SERRSCBI_23976 (plasmid) [Serratia sp. SCBI]|nr:hypothetical protein SERRSCBI_23976 [Serratia sp. SCBI]
MLQLFLAQSYPKIICDRLGQLVINIGKLINHTFTYPRAHNLTQFETEPSDNMILFHFGLA